MFKYMYIKFFFFNLNLFIIYNEYYEKNGVYICVIVEINNDS